VIIFDLEGKRKRLEEIETELAKPDVWDNPQLATSLNKERADLLDDIEFFDAVRRELDDAETLNVLALEEEDEEAARETGRLVKRLQKEIEEAEIRTLLNQRYDRADAIVSINAGAGGTDACDWVEMLGRMYERWAASRGFETHITDYFWGDEAGYRSLEMVVKGKYAYGLLKAERGVHRLIRISPFDFSGKRHTSFASVDVIPALSEDIEIEIDPKDLKIETFRSSGPGGQHVNVTDSAVRITHLPTGISAACQEERSQIKNKETALLILKAKLAEYYEKKRREELERLRGEKKEVAWGSQIRTYTMHSYNLVKDHRTGLEDPRVDRVLDGDIDHFIYAYLKEEARARARDGASG